MLLYNYLLKQKYNIDELNNYYNNLIWCHQISVIRFITSGNILKLENKYQYVDDDLIDRLDISDIEKKKLLTGLRDIYFSLTNNNEITNPFGDLSYNIGLLYSNILLSKFPNNKDIILDEYYNLSKYDEEYLLNKYLKCRELKPTKKLDKMLKIKR